MSQQSIAVLTLTVVAVGSITAGHGVAFDGAAISTQGQKPMGIALTDAIGGAALAVVTHGTAVSKTGAAITLGDALIMDNQGRVIPSTGALQIKSGATAVTSAAANGAILQGGDAPEYVVGDALQAASGAGEFIEILLRR